ncbi:MAG: O-antigen ligase family protein, partial [Cyclobacteriaceae bacterium]
MLVSVGLLMSGSRSASVLAIFACIAVAFMRSVADRSSFINVRLIIYCFVFISILVVSYFLFYESIPQRIIDLVERPDSALANAEDDSRNELFRISYGLFMEKPIFGYGVEAERFIVVSDSGEFHETSAHNTYLHLLSVSG